MKKLLFLTLAMAFFQTAFSQEEVLYSENFENGYLQSNTLKTSTGKFKENAGIKSCVNIAGNKAFGFGRTNCNVGCDRNTTTLKITFQFPTYVKKIEFKEIEKYGNWGSNGAVFIDGKIDNSSFFGRNPANDNRTDNTYRNHTVTVNKQVKTIEFKVIAISSKSEIFIDDIVILGQKESQSNSKWLKIGNQIWAVKKYNDDKNNHENVIVNNNIDADIYINDKYIGYGEIRLEKEIDLKPKDNSKFINNSDLKIKLVKSGYKTEEFTIPVKKNKTTYVYAHMVKQIPLKTLLSEYDIPWQNYYHQPKLKKEEKSGAIYLLFIGIPITVLSIPIFASAGEEGKEGNVFGGLIVLALGSYFIYSAIDDPGTFISSRAVEYNNQVKKEAEEKAKNIAKQKVKQKNQSILLQNQQIKNKNLELINTRSIKYKIGANGEWQYIVKPSVNINTTTTIKEEPVIQNNFTGNSGVFTDTRDNKIYKWVKIGEQIWMAENLAYSTSQSMFYNNDSSKYYAYGKLYNIQEAQNACPLGWHLPTDKEWKTLELSLNINPYTINWTGSRDLKNMKKINIFNITYAGLAQNNNYNIFFSNIYNKGYYWSIDNYIRVFKEKNKEIIIRRRNTRNYVFFSVRCVKD